MKSTKHVGRDHPLRAIKTRSKIEPKRIHEERVMAVRIDKSGSVWTIIHSRPEARNAMDPASADALVAAFQRFGKRHR